MKRTLAAYSVLIGLTALMIGIYIGEFKILSEMLHVYTVLLP